MKWNDWVGVLGNLATVVTAFVAGCAYFGYRKQLAQKRERLEIYLKSEKAADKDQGLRTSLHLVRHLGMTEDEILQASFRSKRIVRRTGKHPVTGAADTLFFGYSDNNNSK